MLVDSPRAFEAFLARATAAEAIALDTEFVWTDSYYPKLGIVQAGLDEHEIYLLDVPALGAEFAEFRAVLDAPRPVKILHDAQQDLTIIRRVTGGTPTNIFDTRRAAGFIGHLSTLSLQNLLREILGIELEKTETRTDWLARPLSPKQLAYARDDIRHLHDLRTHLLEAAHRLHRVAWVEEEMRLYDDRMLYEDAPASDAFRKTKGQRDLNRRSLAVLRELVSWREREARRQDRPRGWVVADEVLAAIARRLPGNSADLKRVGGIPPRMAGRYGQVLLECVAIGMAVPDDECPEIPRAPLTPPGFTTALKTAQAMLQETGARERIDPALVCNRAQLESFLRLPPNKSTQSPLCRGWRATFIGEALRALCPDET